MQLAEYKILVSRMTHSSTTTNKLSEISSTEEDVYDLIRSLPKKTACGPDSISSAMLKGTIDALVPSLTDVFNLSLSSGTVPDEWKRSNITPVFKSGDPKYASNYHPSSLLSLPSKLLERIVCRSLMPHILSNSLLSGNWVFFVIQS